MSGTAAAEHGNSLLSIIAIAATLLGAGLGAGGGLRYLVDPFLRRGRLGKVMATGLWLSCHELRLHLESISDTLAVDPSDNETRQALRKIPINDSHGQADWFVKDGYFSVITAYKIAVFSSWMRIYQLSVLQAVLIRRSSRYTADLFQKFDAFKVAASTGTVLWYSYIDAVGERLIVESGDYSHPADFAQFCKLYFEDQQFLSFFDQLHMFIHFLGRTDDPWKEIYSNALRDMIQTLRALDASLVGSNLNLLGRFQPKERVRAPSAKLPEVRSDQ